MRQTHIDPTIPSDQDATLARTAQRVLESSAGLNEALHLQINAAGQQMAVLDLPPIVTRLLLDILKETASGKAVSLVSVEAEITTHQAAAILQVSRLYLIGMIDKGILPARMVGSHRRLLLQDVLAYKADHRAKRRDTATKRMSMPLRSIADIGTYDECQIIILVEAFRDALDLAGIDDKTGRQAAALAERVIDLFEAGEEDPRQIARLAAGN